MGYAKLWFDNAGANTITHVLHDIVGVITGTYTSTSQLTVADRTLSEIVNTRNSNWSFLYPSAHGAKGNANTSWVLTAPCESSNTKLKYVRISSHATNTGTGQAGGTSLFSVATNGGGVKLTCATAATSNTAVSNETYYNATVTATSGAVFHQFVGNFITLSWSQRHLIMFGPTGSNLRQAFTGCVETTETPISTFRNVAPFLFFYRGHLTAAGAQSYAGYNVNSGSGTSATVDTPASGAFAGTRLDAFLQMNHYDPTTTTASGIHNIFSNINGQVDEMTLFAEQIIPTTSVSIPTTFTKSSTGQNAIYMQPLFYHQSHIGIPHMYISNLADVYRVPNNIGNNFDTFTVGSNTYVYLVAETGQTTNVTGGTYYNCAGGFALAVRKA